MHEQYGDAGDVEVVEISCPGRCDIAPAATVDEQPAEIPIAAMAAPPAGAGAPPPPAHNGMAYWIKVSARDDGSFTVTNTAVRSTDVVLVNHSSGGTAGSYLVQANAIANGSFAVTVSNV